MRCILSIDMGLGLGTAERIPWYSPVDLKRFKHLTANSTMLMGRKTFFSLPINKRPLPGLDRKSIVLTRDPHDSKFDSYREHVNLQIVRPEELTIDHDTMIVIGGSQVYNLFREDITILYLTVMKAKYSCDTFLNLVWSEWNVIEYENHEDHEYYVMVKKH